MAHTRAHTHSTQRHGHLSFPACSGMCVTSSATNMMRRKAESRDGGRENTKALEYVQRYGGWKILSDAQVKTMATIRTITTEVCINIVSGSYEHSSFIPYEHDYNSSDA